MKISIVIPTYNSEKFVTQTLRSIIYQDYKDYEIIAVDGGSKDNTLPILDHYQRELKSDRMRYISEPDKGEPDAINKGMKMATGDIVAYIDSDDIYCPRCFEHVSEYFSNHKEMWAYGRCKIIDSEGRVTRQMVTRFKELFQPHYRYEGLQIFDYLAQPSVFWRRQVVEEIGFLDIEKKLAFEYDYWLRIGKKYRAGFINHYLSCWRSQPQSETAKALAKDMKQGLELAIKHSPKQWYLRPFQYGVYGLSVMGYRAMGAMK